MSFGIRDDVGFSTQGTEQALARVFKQYADLRHASMPELIDHMGEQIAIGNPQYPGLYYIAMAERSAQRAEISGLPERLGYKIRRRLGSSLSPDIDVNTRTGKRFKYGSLEARTKRKVLNRGHERVSIKEEIQLRLRWAATYQASGWLSSRYTLSRGMVALANPGGVVVSNLSGDRATITLINTRINSAEYAARRGHILRAVQSRLRDMRDFIEKRMKQRAAQRA